MAFGSGVGVGVTSWSRVCAVLVVVALGVGAVPGAVAQPVAPGAVLGAPPDTAADTAAAEIAGELVELRTATSRTWEMWDGSRRLEVFPAAIHRRDGDSGAFVPTLGGLQSTEDGFVVGDTEGGVSATLPTDLAAGLVEVASAEGQVGLAAVTEGSGVRSAGRVEGRPGKGWSPLGREPHQSLSDQAPVVRYEDATPGVDVELAASVAGVKETRILAGPDAARSSQFRIEAEGLTPVLRGDGAIELVDGDGETLWMLPAPFMLDSADQPSRSEGVAFNLDGEDPQLVTMTATDEMWLTDPARVVAGSG